MLKFGLIGCGRIGTMHANILHQEDDVLLESVFDINKNFASKCIIRDFSIQIKQGDRIGMIRFGSRVDLYFKNKKVLVKLGQNVVAGESLIASE